MTESAMITAFTQSGFAGAFVILLVWVLRTNAARESRYITLIEQKQDAMHNDIRAVQADVRDIKAHIESDTGPLRRRKE